MDFLHRLFINIIYNLNYFVLQSVEIDVIDLPARASFLLISDKYAGL